MDVSAESFRVVHRETAEKRQPPNRFDLTVWASKPGAVSLLSGGPEPRRVDVPGLPGAFLVVDALSARECELLLASAETMGFERWRRRVLALFQRTRKGGREGLVPGS